jgi:hypothetical protein
MSFQENIQKWVQIDNQLRVYNEKIKELREKKSQLTMELNDQADDNNYRDSVIQITDGKLKFTETKTQSPLTFRYVEDILGAAISDKGVCAEIIKRLKDNRDVKISHDLKRYNT